MMPLSLNTHYASNPYIILKKYKKYVMRRIHNEPLYLINNYGFRPSTRRLPSCQIGFFCQRGYATNQCTRRSFEFVTQIIRGATGSCETIQVMIVVLLAQTTTCIVETLDKLGGAVEFLLTGGRFVGVWGSGGAEEGWSYLHLYVVGRNLREWWGNEYYY